MKKITLNYLYFTIFFLILKIPVFSQREFSFGCIKDTSIKEFEVFPVTRGELPSSYSLFHLMPKIKSQGNIGSCVSWSTVYGAMTIVKRIENGDFTEIPFSAMAVHSAYRNYYDSLCKSYSKKYGSESPITKHSCNMKECSEGAYPREILERLKKYGTRKMYENEPNSPCPQENSTTIYEDKIYDFSFINSGAPIDFKKALLANSPLILVIDHYNMKDWSDDQYFNEGVWDGITEGDLAGSHAMLIVGYDDNKAGGAIHVVNSWGDDFGINGTFWIKYEDIKKINYACRIIIDPKKNSDLSKINYKSNKLKDLDKSKIVEEPITSNNSNNTGFFIEKLNGSTLKVDYHNKDNLSLGNITKLKYSTNRKYVTYLRNSENELVLLKNNKKDWFQEKDINFSEIPKNSFYTLNLQRNKLFKIKSIFICDNTRDRRTFSDNDVKVALITEENKVFVWSPIDNGLKEIFGKAKHLKIIDYDHIYVNDMKNSIVSISKKGAIWSYDIFKNRYSRTVKGAVSLKVSSHVSTGESDLIIGENNIIDIKLYQRNSYNFWTKLAKIVKASFPIEYSVSSNIVNGSIEKIEYDQSLNACFVLADGVLMKYDLKKSKMKRVELNYEKPLNTFFVHGEKNLCVYSNSEQIFLYDLKNNIELKRFGKINNLIGFTKDGSIIAMDERNSYILFDSKWLY